MKTKNTPNLATTIMRSIRADVLDKMKGEQGRVSLLANGIAPEFVRQFTDEEAWWLSLCQINEFLGIRPPSGMPSSLDAKLKVMNRKLKTP